MWPWRYKDKLLCFTAWLNYVVVALAVALYLSPAWFYVYFTALAIWVPCAVVSWLRLNRNDAGVGRRRLEMIATYEKTHDSAVLPPDMQEELMINRARRMLAEGSRDEA